MAYDESMAQRLREILESEDSVVERKMFGGLAFMIHGNMAVGVMGSEGAIMVRVGPDAYEDALALPGANKVVGNFRPMKGFVFVETETIEDDEVLVEWLDRGLAFARSLPAK